MPDPRQMDVMASVRPQPRGVGRRRERGMVRRRREGAVREGGGRRGGRQRGTGAGSAGDARDGRLLLVGAVAARHRRRPRVGVPGMRPGRPSSRRVRVVRVRMVRPGRMMSMHGRLGPSVVPLDLGGRVGQEVDVEGGGPARARTAAPAASVRTQDRAPGAGAGDVRVGGRDVGGADGGGRGGLRHGVGRGHHHGRGGFVRVSRQGGHLVGFVPPARVGVVVDPRVAGQFVGPTEAFGAAGEQAAMGLFAGVGPNVSGLVLQAMKGLFAQRTFVGTGEILPAVVGDAVEQRWDPAHGGHGIDAPLAVVTVGRGRGIQQMGEVERR